MFVYLFQIILFPSAYFFSRHFGCYKYSILDINVCLPISKLSSIQPKATLMAESLRYYHEGFFQVSISCLFAFLMSYFTFLWSDWLEPGCWNNCCLFPSSHTMAFFTILVISETNLYIPSSWSGWKFLFTIGCNEVLRVKLPSVKPIFRW